MLFIAMYTRITVSRHCQFYTICLCFSSGKQEYETRSLSKPRHNTVPHTGILLSYAFNSTIFLKYIHDFCIYRVSFRGGGRGGNLPPP